MTRVENRVVRWNNSILCQSTAFDFVTAIDPCDAGPCMNGGTCESENQMITCFCAPGFVGVMCQMGKFINK